MDNFAERIINFNRKLRIDINLPEGIRVMNPFDDNPEAFEVSSAFYRKYYSDNNKRRLILGINPGRFGAGITGIPFTDTKRLEEKCGLRIDGFTSHEPSSVFIYDVIDAFGGAGRFYSEFYINSACPLGFTVSGNKGKEVNYNYYDSRELATLLRPFIIKSIRDHISMGIDTRVAYCLGTGKNYKIIDLLNGEYRFFNELVPLEHPRYIMQYRSKQKEEYIEKYLRVLNQCGFPDRAPCIQT